MKLYMWITRRKGCKVNSKFQGHTRRQDVIPFQHAGGSQVIDDVLQTDVSENRDECHPVICVQERLVVSRLCLSKLNIDYARIDLCICLCGIHVYVRLTTSPFTKPGISIEQKLFNRTVPGWVKL